MCSSDLGTNEHCQVSDSIRWITEHLGIAPELQFTGGERGWIGDSPFIFLDCAKIRALGWEPKLTIQQCIVCTLQYLVEHEWLLEK